MTARAKLIIDEALRLSEKERARIAAAMLASISDDPDDDAQVEAEWAEEIVRRARRPTTSRLIPWPEVRKRLLKRKR